MKNQIGVTIVIGILGVAGLVLLGGGVYFGLDAFSTRHTVEGDLTASRTQVHTDNQNNQVTTYQVRVALAGHGSQWVSSEPLYDDYSSGRVPVSVDVSDVTGDVVHVRGPGYSVEIGHSTARVVGTIVASLSGLFILSLSLWVLVRTRRSRRQSPRTLFEKASS